ncbi:MAG: CapA family protein [Gammaproteobacteria bacterium]|nr:CapA family protein [Gammaproteobacteria bacterium]
MSAQKITSEKHYVSANSTRLLLLITVLLGLSACATPRDAEVPEIIKKEESEAYSQKLTIVAVGDIMLGGTARPELEKFGYDYPFANVESLLTGADITFGNLEGPLTHGGSSDVEKKYRFRSPPDKVAPALKRAGFDVVSLANNHTLDYGQQGLVDTMAALDDAGIAYAGAGLDASAARRAVVLTVNGSRIAFLAYSLTFPEEFWAGDSRAGTAFGHAEHVKRDVTKAGENADIVVVSFHWGREGTTELRDYQMVLGRAAIDSGAALVLGHHPHILQGIERYGKGVIFYSLGNFVFGSYSKTAQRSAIVSANFNNNELESIQIQPIDVNNINVVFQPVLLTGDESKDVIDHLNLLSNGLGVALQYQDGVGKILLTEGRTPIKKASK